MRFLIFLVLSTSCFAGTYYVDFEHDAADDTGPGTQDIPWKHCPGMPGWSGTIQLQAGDTLYFYNTSTWPIAEGNSIIQAVGGVTYDGRSWGTGTRATLKAEVDLNRTVVNFMDDHPDIPTVVKGFDINANNHVTSGVGMNWPQMQRHLDGAVKRVEDCIVHDIYSRQSQGQYEYGIVVSSWYELEIHNVEILDCKVFNISRTGIANYPGNDSPNNRTENVIFRGNEVYNTGLDPDAPGAGFGIGLKNHTVNAVVEYNTIYETVESGMIITTHPEQDFRGPENAVIRYNIIRDSEKCGIFIQQRGDKSFDIYGNIIFNNAYEGIRFTSSLSNNLSAGIYNNTLFNNYVLDWSQEIRIESNIANIQRLELKNNIISASSETRCLVDDNGDITDHSHNLYYRENGNPLVISNGTSFRDTEIELYEPTGLNGIPGFQDTTDLPSGFSGTWGVDAEPDKEGFNLILFSPAVDYGIDLGNGFGSSINSIPRPSGPSWDLGAYEFVQECGDFLQLNQDVFFMEDLFFLEKKAVNATSVLVNACDFVLLDVYGVFFFWPSWDSNLDCNLITMPANTSNYQIVLEFTFPPEVGSADGIYIHAGLLNTDDCALFGAISSVAFDYRTQ